MSKRTEWLAKKLGNHLTQSSGINIIFESAIVPQFSLKDSRITFRNVYISRGPLKSREGKVYRRRGFRHNKNETSLIREVFYNVQNHLGLSALAVPSVGENDLKAMSLDVATDEEEVDLYPNWTRFHVNVDTIDVSLSLWQWLDGKGLVKDAVVNGVRGVVGKHFTT